MRTSKYLTGLVATLTFLGSPLADATPLTPNPVLHRAGLERAWFSQTNLNAARNRLEGATLEGNMLVTLSSAGFVEAFDAETGEQLWATRVGNPDHFSLGPAVGTDVIAVINGATLHVLNRADRVTLLSRELGGAPAGAPAIGTGFVFVPLISGRVEGYPTDQPEATPWYYTSAGRVFSKIVAGRDHVFWCTDTGFMIAAGIAATGVDYRFESVSDFVAPPAAGNGIVYAATAAGYMYAIAEESGSEVWRYSTGFPILRSPVAVGNDVYLVTEEPALHRLSNDGVMKWVTPGVAKFIAQSETRVYGLDRFGGVLVLDGETGVVLHRTDSRSAFNPVLNTQTDRLYVFSDDGLLQCFHEIGADEPFLHRPPASTEEGVAEAKPEDAKPGPAAAPKPAEVKPAPAQASPAGGVPDPFGGEDPFGGDPFGGENPF